MKRRKGKTTSKFLALLLTVTLVFCMSGYTLAAETQSSGSDVKTEDQSGGDKAQAAGDEAGEKAADQKDNGEKDGAENETISEDVPDAANEGGVEESPSIKNVMKKSSEDNKVGDFIVQGDEADYEFDEGNGILHIKGDVRVSTGGVETTQSIIVEKSCMVVLAGVNINSASGPAIMIQSPNNVELVLAEGSKNKVTGADGNHINHVSTQIPYAVSVAAISFVMYLLAGFVNSAAIVLPVGVVVTIGFLFVMKAIVTKKYGKENI